MKPNSFLSFGWASLRAPAKSLHAVAPLAVACGAVWLLAAAACGAAQIRAEIEINAQNQTTELIDPLGYIEEHLSTGGGVADAMVGLGWMRLSAFMGATVIQTTPRITIEGYAVAKGSWSDEMTITPAKASLLNTPGVATFAMNLDGFYAALGNINISAQATYADASARVLVNGGVAFAGAAQFPGTDTGDTINEILEFDINFIFGQPFAVSVAMDATASATFDYDFIRIGDSGFGQTDLRDTLEWMGAVRVIDELSEEVTDYMLTSPSGVDYRNPIAAPAIPEPSALALLALASVALCCRRTRTRWTGERWVARPA